MDENEDHFAYSLSAARILFSFAEVGIEPLARSSIRGFETSAVHRERSSRPWIPQRDEIDRVRLPAAAPVVSWHADLDNAGTFRSDSGEIQVKFNRSSCREPKFPQRSLRKPRPENSRVLPIGAIDLLAVGAISGSTREGCHFPCSSNTPQWARRRATSIAAYSSQWMARLRGSLVLIKLRKPRKRTLWR